MTHTPTACSTLVQSALVAKELSVKIMGGPLSASAHHNILVTHMSPADQTLAVEMPVALILIVPVVERELCAPAEEAISAALTAGLAAGLTLVWKVSAELELSVKM